MSINLDGFKPLAELLLEKGVPMLANIFLPGIGGNLANALMPLIAQTLGLSSDASPEDIAAAVQADPDAANKLAVIQEAHSEALSFAQKALEANQSVTALEPTFFGRLFVGGWRPAMGWVGVFALIYQMFASSYGLKPLTTETFAIAIGAWSALAGVRSIEMVKGLASSAPMTFSKPTVKKVR